MSSEEYLHRNLDSEIGFVAVWDQKYILPLIVMTKNSGLKKGFSSGKGA